MNKATDFLQNLPAQDSNTVFEALENAAYEGDVNSTHDWEGGVSHWIFEDESVIEMDGPDVRVICAESSQ